MKYTVEMGSGGMIYLPSFIKIGSGIQRLMGGIHRQHGDHVSLLSFFFNNESRLKIRNLLMVQLLKVISAKCQLVESVLVDITHRNRLLVCVITCFCYFMFANVSI
jgi:hypothetical protein